MTPKELQERIEHLRKEIDGVCTFHVNSGSEISKRQSELFICASQLAEISSRRLERQTGLLIGLTWTLVAFTAVLVVLTFYIVKHG